jgi:PAS domain S-box-containing protein
MTLEKVNILLVDDQPAKLLSYEVILKELGENLIKASSGREALEQLLRNEIAVVLVDVCMPDLDGFQLASMIREHPRFQRTTIIFISAIQVTDLDSIKGYELGGVDYVPVPVIPEVLRAKVRVFAELYRKTRQLEQLNSELERRVVERTAELEASNARLRESERRRSVALAAGQMGSWDWDVLTGECVWDAGQYRIFGIEPDGFQLTFDNIKRFIHPDDLERIQARVRNGIEDKATFQTEARLLRPDGTTRWCICAAAVTLDDSGRVVRVSGVTIDISERKSAEERQLLLAREVDHRAKNALALVQAIVRMTRGANIESYMAAVEGRIKALSRVHTVLSQSRWEGAVLGGLVDEELAPYRSGDPDKVVAIGPEVVLQPATAQTLALALHELVTNAAKYGALSTLAGRVKLSWELRHGALDLHWTESGGPTVKPASPGFGTRIVVASIERQLGGKVSFDWRPDGLHCVLSVPRSNEMEISERASRGRRSLEKDHAGAAASGLAIAGSRVMIVEDEALVAMVVADALTELGYSVLGPFSRPADALAAIKDQEIDAAILDVNLAGEMVYPLADVLVARGVPIVFVTGYGIESIERRFADFPILQKPIERQSLQNIFVAANVNAQMAVGGGRAGAVSAAAASV